MRLLRLGVPLRHTPLHDAALRGDEPEAHRLVHELRMVCVDVANDLGATPLHCACLNGHTKVARMLLDAGAVPNHCTPRGYTPLHEACHGGQVDTVRLLLERGAAVDEAAKEGATPLSVACEEGHVETV